MNFVHKAAFLLIVLRCENLCLSLRTRSRCDGGHIKGEGDGLAYSTHGRNEKHSKNFI